ncbi:MAG: cupin domain-containing protein [Candidatus Scalindua sp.]|nr:cupin domain-containing protein [Candidatus Scalindua sp.]
MNLKNIFENIPEQIPEEVLEEVFRAEHFRIERIISRGHSTGNGEWYDQGHDEWMIVLRGSAGLLFEGDHTAVMLKPGDYINIPAHRKHRVEWTDPREETVWLAIHY